MNRNRSITNPFTFVIATMFALVAGAASADVSTSTVALQGYDVVSYFEGDGVPVKGSGRQVAYHEGEVYLFSSRGNRRAFEANPEQYLPAYGGFCAFGVTGGNKLVGDPLAYRVVDDTLYLNVNEQIQERWARNIPRNIERADERWPEIKDIHPADL
ncbi:MAG: YHS domain-containing (seleno)protein [Pseudomonadota bacterium]